jgi:hypothetical protein
MSELLNWLLDFDNRKTCRIVGLLFIALPLIFFFSGGFTQGADGQGIIFSSGWFREVFLVIMSLVFLIGLILTLAGFTRRKENK